MSLFKLGKPLLKLTEFTLVDIISHPVFPCKGMIKYPVETLYGILCIYIDKDSKDKVTM